MNKSNGLEDPSPSLHKTSSFDADKFQKIAVGIQAIVLSLAALCAGSWALYTFTSLNQRLKSRLELEDLQRRNQLRGILEFRLDLSQEPDDTGQLLIHAQVSAENKGNKDMVIEEDTEEPLNAYRVMFNRGTEDQFRVITQKAGSAAIWGGSQDAAQNQQVLARQTIRAGETRLFHGILKVATPGTYYITFEAPIHSEDKPQEKEVRWSATNYISIK